MAESDNIVIQHLLAIRGQIERCNERLLDTIQRMGNLDAQLANLFCGLDSIDGRLDRIERRLGLIEMKV